MTLNRPQVKNALNPTLIGEMRTVFANLRERAITAIEEWRAEVEAGTFPGVEESVELAMVPRATVTVSDESVARKIVRLVEGLEDTEDVQDVYANFDISDELMEAVG